MKRFSSWRATGKLRSGLPAQVTRMLADSRSDRFVKHFVRRWLDLDNIGTMPPSEDFLEYYRDNLETAMRAETETFFRHVLDNNLPLREFLDADYSFLNRELALHYGIEGVQGNELQRVSLKGSRRGGLLGQGAFLTASANGVDTSPVVRGIYVLEKLLGYTPPPPPPDIPAIEPDIRGAVTIREQLEKHRESRNVRRVPSQDRSARLCVGKFRRHWRLAGQIREENSNRFLRSTPGRGLVSDSSRIPKTPG